MKKIKEFKAMVIDKDTNEFVMIQSKYASKKNFIEDLRKNGYRVNPNRVVEVK